MSGLRVLSRPGGVLGRRRLHVVSLMVTLGVALTVLAGCGSSSNNDASSQSGAGHLPTGYPSTSVPVASGSITASSTQGGTWDVTVSVSDATAQQQALQALKSKGFQIIGQSKTTTPQDTAYSLASSAYSVRLGFSKTDAGYFVDYGVAPRPSATQSSAPKKGASKSPSSKPSASTKKTTPSETTAPTATATKK